MATAEDRLADTLETAVEDLEFRLDEAGVDFEVAAPLNANQCIIVFADGSRHAYVSTELSWDDTPMVFVDIYSVDAYGEEAWVCGDLSVSEALTHIINV